MCLNPLFYMNPKKVPHSIFVGRLRAEARKKEDCRFPAQEAFYVSQFINEKGFLSKAGRELLYTHSYFDLNEHLQELPCRKCIECRMQSAREWSARCKLEVLSHSSSYFVTLTYDEKHVPRYADGMLGIRYKDFQLFMKRLRKAVDYPIRYREVDEYGSKTRRPHFHALLFGLRLHDLQYLYSMINGRKMYQDNRGGQPHYNSPWLRKIWRNGNVDIAAVEHGSISYVNDYMLKFELDEWHGDEEDAYNQYCDSFPHQAAAYVSAVKLGVIPPPRTHQSTRPAIGRNAYEELKQTLIETDAYPSGYDLRVRYIHYFDRLLFEEYPALKEPRLRERANLAKAVAYDPEVDPDIQFTPAWIDEQKKRRKERLLAMAALRSRPLE